MIATTTTRTTQSGGPLLTRLAERWRPVGLYLASLDRDGFLLWHDPQMPRILSLCLTVDSVIPHQVKRVGEAVTADGIRLHAQLPSIQVQLVPIMKRRKVHGWIAFIGRTDLVRRRSTKNWPAFPSAPAWIPRRWHRFPTRRRWCP